MRMVEVWERRYGMFYGLDDPSNADLFKKVELPLDQREHLRVRLTNSTSVLKCDIVDIE